MVKFLTMNISQHGTPSFSLLNHKCKEYVSTVDFSRVPLFFALIIALHY